MESTPDDEPAERPRTRRTLLEERQRWLEGALGSLQRDSNRSPWLLLTGFLAIPVGLKWGVWPAVFVVGVAVSLWLVGLYVTWTHRNEYENEAESIRRQLEEMDEQDAAR